MAYTNAKMRLALGDPVTETETDLDEMFYPACYRTSLHGDFSHGWQSGTRPSIYRNDEEFRISVYYGVGAPVIRTSVFTPPTAWTMLGQAFATINHVNHGGGFSFIDNGLMPQLKALAAAWAEQRTRVPRHPGHRPNNDRTKLTDSSAVLLSKVILAFTHEARPLVMTRYLETAARWHPKRSRNGPKVVPSWADALEGAATQIAKTFGNSTGNHGYTHMAFRKVMAMLANEYVENLHPGFSFHCLMDDSLHDVIKSTHGIGQTFPWSNGRIVPFSSKAKAEEVLLTVRHLARHRPIKRTRRRRHNGEAAEEVRYPQLPKVATDKIIQFAFGINREEMETRRAYWRRFP